MIARADVEDFLYAEAALLDAWKLEEWLALWTADGQYLVPAPLGGDPATTLNLIADDMPSLRARVHQLVTGTAWTEVPRSRTVHMITNVRVVESTEQILVRSVFSVHRSRGDRQDLFAGTYEHTLVPKGGSLRIRRKCCTLAHDQLHAQAKLSILL